MSKKKRKKRTTGYDLCDCGYVNCDPSWGFGRNGLDKIHKRLEEGKCMGCGQPKKECTCKSA
jgi:hypothetical protein